MYSDYLLNGGYVTYKSVIPNLGKFKMHIDLQMGELSIVQWACELVVH